MLAAVEAVGADLAIAGLALADMGGLKGRGERHRLPIDGGHYLLIDESYNANPASMAATLKALGEERDVERRIAVLGPMRELGEHADELHASLAPDVLEARVDHLILVGEEMRPLEKALDGAVAVDRADDVEAATELLARLVRPGDAVLVKASNSIGLAKLVERMAGGLQMATLERVPALMLYMDRRAAWVSRASSTSSATSASAPARRPRPRWPSACCWVRCSSAGCAPSRARASRSAPTGRKATSPSAARRPWAAC